MADLIDRRAALQKWDELSERGRTEFDQVLMMMPAAQLWGDAISRQAVEELMFNERYGTVMINLFEFDQLPPVEPIRKRGHWKLTHDDQYEYCTCSECGYVNGENWMIGSQIRFCANCGCQMIEESEVSDAVGD